MRHEATLLILKDVAQHKYSADLTKANAKSAESPLLINFASTLPYMHLEITQEKRSAGLTSGTLSFVLPT